MTTTLPARKKLSPAQLRLLGYVCLVDDQSRCRAVTNLQAVARVAGWAFPDVSQVADELVALGRVTRQGDELVPTRANFHHAA